MTTTLNNTAKELFEETLYQKRQAVIAELGFEGLHVDNQALLHFTTAVKLRMGDLADGYFKMGLFEHDSTNRMNLLLKAANLGNPNAQYLAGLNYVVMAQYGNAFTQLLTVAEQGNSAAQTMIRTMALEGLIQQPYSALFDFVTPTCSPKHHLKHVNAKLEEEKEIAREEEPHPHR